MWATIFHISHAYIFHIEPINEIWDTMEFATAEKLCQNAIFSHNFVQFTKVNIRIGC